MSQGRIDRLTIRCEAPPQRRRAAQAMQRRLEDVARHHLPAALERTLDDVDLLVPGPVRVRLEFDPSAYDDVTVAVLWADLIRRSLRLDHVEPPGEPGERRSRPRSVAPGPPEPGPEIGEGELARAAAAALRGDAAALERLVAVLHRGGRPAAVRLRAALRDADVAAMVGRLRNWARRIAGSPATGTAGDVAMIADPPPPLASERPLPPLDPVPEAEWQAACIEAATAFGVRSRSAREAARSRPAPGAPGEGTGAADETRRRAHSTFAGGLVLLYPWLADLVDTACQRAGRSDGVVRRYAFSRLVPDLAGAEDDPLVRVLSGEPLEGPLPDVDAAVMPEVDDAAAAVLSAFAAVLPGFAGSSAEFIRRELVVRSATIEEDDDRFVAVLDPRPLDLLLDRLPYPLATFRLPWTGEIAVVLRRA